MENFNMNFFGQQPNGGASSDTTNFLTNQPHNFMMPQSNEARSYMDLITGTSPMIPDNISPRFNPYHGMYPHPYRMENSAMRLQQFARQMNPRAAANPYMGSQMPGMYSQMDPMTRMRMKQAEMASRYQGQLQWPRMPHTSMPILQQQQMPRMMQNDAMQMPNMMVPQSPGFRKMPVLDEAPMAHRNMSLQQQHHQQQSTQQPQQQPQQQPSFSSLLSQNFPDNTSNNASSPSFTQKTSTTPVQQQQQQQVNLNSTTETLNLPSVDFTAPSPQAHKQQAQQQPPQQQAQTQQKPLQTPQPQNQQQPQISIPNFLDTFTNELNNISPLSPKLTHFPGPRPSSSVTTFEKTTMVNQKPPSVGPTPPAYRPTTPNTVPSSPSNINFVSPDYAPPASPLNTINLQNQLQQLVMQMGHLRQAPQNQQTMMQMQMLTRKYEFLYRKMELSKQMNAQQQQMQQQPRMQVIPKSDAMQLNQQQLPQLNIPPQGQQQKNAQQMQQQPQPIPQPSPQQQFQQSPQHIQQSPQHLQQSPQHMQQSPQRQIQPSPQQPQPQQNVQPQKLPEPVASPAQQEQEQTLQQQMQTPQQTLQQQLQPLQQKPLSPQQLQPVPQPTPLINSLKKSPQPVSKQTEVPLPVTNDVPQEQPANQEAPSILDTISETLNIPDLSDLPTNQNANFLQTETKPQQQDPMLAGFLGAADLFGMEGTSFLDAIKAPDPIKPPEAAPPTSVATSLPKSQPNNTTSAVESKDVPQPATTALETPKKTVQLTQPPPVPVPNQNASEPRKLAPLQPQMWNPQQMQQQRPTYQMLKPMQAPPGSEGMFLPYNFHHPSLFPGMQQNPFLQNNMQGMQDLKNVMHGMGFSMGAANIPYPPNLPAMQQALKQQQQQQQQQAQQLQQPKFPELPKKGGKGKGSGKTGGKGSGKGSGKGKSRPPAAKKKKEKKIDLELADFDEIAPTDMINDEALDPAMRRSLRDRSKKKSYKDDFEFNLSDDESKKAQAGTAEGEGDGNKGTMEPAISGGVNQLLAYRPNLEVEGEIAIIDKILAMRVVPKEIVTPASEEGIEPTKTTQNVEEYYVKYKGYSYLHCEWGNIDELLKKDKRVHNKVKRYQQKRDSSIAHLNELDDEPFNPDFIEIDRVLDVQTTVDPVSNETLYHYLVKWRGLPYEDSTWELQMNIDQAIIDQFYQSKKPPPMQFRQYITRPSMELEWKNFQQSPVYKNGHKLHDYQLEGLNWLTFCWYKRINCILADEMGLGKTIQSISLLCAIKQHGIRGPFLVIAPLSTIVNWQREFEEWSDINAIVYHGSAQSRNNIQQYEMRYKDENGEEIPDIYKFEAIITTYEMVLSANSFLCTIPFRCLIIDEAHRLKNQKCKLMEGLMNLQMEHRVLLTGTPLQNNVEELYSLLNFLEPTRFPSQAAFLCEFGDLKSEGQVAKLKEILKPMMLRRLKEDVAQDIGSKEETIVEVELTTIQKKFYRAILEKNFSFLAKGAGYSNLPNLMNTMMELRKCCNHPFLINGAEDKIVSEYLPIPDDPDKTVLQMKALIESSGKMVLIDKLLPKLKAGGHKILIFSQMIKVLNLLEDYLVAKKYLFERIDGGVQGGDRQAAIDRFCRPDSDRFVFLLCTRAGGLGINLTAADTVIIFDSDWNPQNDLQAQARCHRIGQEKPVKVYRLICRNTYEREMFDRASLKLGLDKAVLQNMNNKEATAGGNQAMSKKEVEDLLKKGAYGAVMETDDDASKFCEEDIDQILERRTQVIQIKSEGKGSTFAKASFVSDKARQDISLDDPDFWQKWAKKASVDIEELEKDDKLIVDEPRRRKQTKRFGNDGDATVEMSDFESDDETFEPAGQTKGRGRPSSLPSGPVERAAWTRVECFKIEKGLLVYGWGRWEDIASHARFRQDMKPTDIEAITRTILAYCFRLVRSDDLTKQFFVKLVDESVKNAPPKNDKLDITSAILSGVPSKTLSKGRKGRGSSARNALRRLTNQYSKPALIECDANWQTVDETEMIVDAGYRKHLQKDCHKIMSRVRLLSCLADQIIKDARKLILENAQLKDIDIEMPAADGEMLAEWWQPEADKSLIVGTFKHGYEKYDLMRADECLFFLQKLGLPPQVAEKAVSERSEDEKKKPKKENDDEDSFESDDDKDFSGTNSPASVMSAKDSESEKAPNNSSTVKEAHWPSVNDLNARLRRLINLLVKSSEQDHLEIIKPEKDKQRQEKLAVIAMERQRKKQELSQKWTRREEADFYRIISNFGLIYDQHKKCYSWKKFRDLARLDKKHDDSLTSYFEEFMAMCRRVTKRSSTDDMKRYQGPNLIEEISEERANRCLQRVKLLNKIRCDVLPHELLEERLKLCDISPEFPPWWITGKHDRALLEGLARFGFGRTECQILMDPKGPFREIALQMKGKSLPVNGEHDDGKYPPVSFTAEFSQILPTWPKDKAIIYHMEKVCQCVLKGTWPKITRFDISSHVNKVSVIPSNHVSTVGHTTRSENVVNDGYRRQHVAVNNEKDFKIKRIDGLKLTVKSQDLKKSSINNKGGGLDERKNDKYAPSSKVQIHIPKSREGDTSSRSKPVIHFPQKPQSSSVIKNLKDERESIIKYPQDTRHREKHHHFSEMERKEREFFAKEERFYQKEREERKDPHLFPKQSREERRHFYPKVREEKKDFYSKDERKDFHPKDERKDFYPKDERKDLYSKDERKDLYLKDKDLYAKDERKDLYAKERELYSRSTSQEVKSPPPPRKETSVLPPPAVGKDKDSPSSEPIGIPIDSPNSNVRIQGSKIEINKCTKRDLSSVITKDNDLFYEKKRPRPDSFYDERPPPHKEHFSPTTKDPMIKSNRPERSAKKRAKDSITEMTEAENLHRHNEISKYSPSEFNSPLAIKSRDFYRHELYNERRSPYHELYEHAPLSRFHSRHSPEPRHHGRLSPPLHMLHERSLSPHKHHIRSPVIEKQLRSPSEAKHRHHHMRSPPPIDHDHMKHMKHHRALSPSAADYHHHLKSPSSSHKHHHGGDKHFEHGFYGGLDYYHERSTSPLFYDHFDKKRYTSSSYDRASPPSYKHPLDKHSPTCMKHDKFPYHMSDSVADRSKHSKDEYRFPYGCSGGEFSRFEKSESPCHYQPLSRSRVDSADKKHHHDNLHFQPPKLYEGAALLKDVIHSSPTHPHHSPPVCSKSIEHKRYLAQSKTKITRDPPTSFYPTDKPIVTSKPPRPVIEIPEPSRENALPPERKTPTAKKRKGLGSLLESKILDLKKQRMGIDEKSQDTSPTEENGSSVIDTVSSSVSVVIPEVSTPPPKTTPNKPKGGKSLSLDQIAKNLSKSAEKVESLSLDQIAKNLTKSAEKVEHTGSVHRVSVLREITEPSANTKEEETAKPSS